MIRLQQVLLLAIKDLRLFFQDKGTVAFAFGFPLVLAFSFSSFLPAAELDEVVKLRVASGESEAGISHAIIQALDESAQFEVIELGPDEAFRQVEDETISRYLLFPEGMTDALLAGEPTSIQVVTRTEYTQSDALLLEVASSLSRELSLSREAVAAAVNLAIGEGQVPDDARIAQVVAAALEQGGGQPAAGIEFVQVGDIEPVPAANYVMSAYITMFIFFAAGFGAGELIRERRQHTLDRLVASGVSPSTILAGKWAGVAARALAQAIVLWAAALLLFGIDMGHDPLATVLVTLAMLVASASFALFLATIARTQNSADSVTVLVSLTMAALGGSWWPLFIMPEWMQTLAKVTPHAWANEAFNNLLLFGATLADVVTNLAVLALFGIVLATLAVVRFNRQAAA